MKHLFITKQYETEFIGGVSTPSNFIYGQGGEGKAELQLCPKCNGQGIVSKPPWIPGDVNEWSSSTSTTFQCDVCKGAKILYLDSSLLSQLTATKAEADALRRENVELREFMDNIPEMTDEDIEAMKERGRYYGFPDCCVKYFAENLETEDRVPESIHCNTGFKPCPACVEKIEKGEATLASLITNRQHPLPFPRDDKYFD